MPSGERCPAGYALVTLYREEELDLLARRSERAHKDEGQLALIVGEPGLGKSRLMEEFHARLGGTPHTWVEWSSSQLLQNTPLHAITEWGLQRFGLNAAPRRPRRPFFMKMAIRSVPWARDCQTPSLGEAECAGS